MLFTKCVIRYQLIIVDTNTECLTVYFHKIENIRPIYKVQHGMPQKLQK